ncbi:hypothetical protein BHE74_00036989 [Ensete ventricosum]|nr:hypothetical protein BHE74_00036989 [Ensete ventricosum]
MCDRGQGPRNWSSGPVLPRWLALGHVVWFGRTTTIIPIIIPPPPEKEALLRSSRRRGGGSFRHGVRMTEGFICSPAPKYSVALSYSTRFFSAVAAISLSSPMPAMLTVSTFIPSLFPPTVSRAGQMSSAFSHSESRSVEILAHRSRVLSRPSGDSMSMAVIPSSSSLGDSGTTNALVTMQSFFNVDSTMTTRRLVKVRKNYFIPPNYERHVPLSGEHPYDAFSCGFSLSTDALKVGLRFLLHHLIEACLEQWRISPSHMAPNLWRYLIAFLWECYVSGIRATQELFMACFWLSRGQAGYYLAARSGFHVRGALSSNKGWKSYFFFISCHQGWSFPTKWTSRTVSSSIPMLSTDETELVEIL